MTACPRHVAAAGSVGEPEDGMPKAGAEHEREFRFGAHLQWPSNNRLAC